MKNNLKLKNNDKISLIKKYYKKNPIFLELILMNYEEFDLYIIINYIKKSNSYRLSWFNLSNIEDANVEKYLSCTYISSDVIELIKKDFLNFAVNSSYNEEILTHEDIVILNANIKTKVEQNINVAFKKYLPKSLGHLLDLFIFIFRNMPKQYENFLFEICAKFTDSTEKYEYKKEFDFDLFNDDIDKIFNYQIIQRGKKYYEENKVSFLEKIDEERYFSIVEGTEKYLVVIKYNEKNKKMQVYCSCPCEFYCKHIYSVILAIRENRIKRFYKIMYKNPNKNLMERIMDFDYQLCLGIVEQNFEIVNNYGEIELIPILDSNNTCNWNILEDSEDEELTKQVRNFINNN